MKFALDERNLAKQFLFWAAITLPILLFLIFGFPLWKNLTFGFSQEAYTLFLEINKFPLYLFGTCVPLVAIVAYMHRTIQTEKQINYTQAQIKLTEDKNKADSYYSHVKFVIDAINSFPETNIKHTTNENLEVFEKFTFTQPYALYKKIFSESSLDNGYSKEMDKNFIAELKGYFKSINTSLSKADDNKRDSESLIILLCDIDRYILGLSELLLIDYNPTHHMYWVQSKIEFTTVSFKNEELLKETLNHLFKSAQRICDFIGMDSNFLRPHPLNDEEQALYFYLTTNERVFQMILPSQRPARANLSLGYISPR